MSHVDLGTDARLTKSMVLDAIDMAEGAKGLEGSETYNESQLRQAISALEGEDADVQKIREESGLSESLVLDAINVVIGKRQKLAYVIHPFRKVLPKWMFKELPMDFMDKDLKSFGFLDKLTKKLKKI